MVLVYTHKITPRLTYVFKQVFTRILLLPVEFTTHKIAFMSYDGMKMSYSKQPLGDEIFIRCTDLLYSHGIDHIEPGISYWDEVPCFFQTSAPSMIPFDLFAASFFLLSRYEEYMPHVRDEHERFTAVESFAYRKKFIEKPVVDIWAYKLREILKKRFPYQQFEKRSFKYLSTIDIDLAYMYKYKGFMRHVGGIVKDLTELQFQKIVERFLIVFNFKKDPYDVYDYILRLHEKHEVELIFFFLLGEYNNFNKNISVNNGKFKRLIKEMADYVGIGVHPSYYTMKDDEKMKNEKKLLESILNSQVYRSRQHFLRIDLPETYQHLIDLGITEDYTMGFAKHYGFRAGTCTPFYFYDLDFEIQTPLKIFPFAVMDGTLKDYLSMTTKKSFETIEKLVEEVKKVDGTFITIFHNESLSGTGRWLNWDKKFEEFLAGIGKN